MSGRPCIFGEALFDIFPDGRRILGGAPFNVAWSLRALGENPLLVSRVGSEANGDSVRTAMKIWGLDESGLQIGPGEHTGIAKVRIAGGAPSFDILHPVAWDGIEPPRTASGFELLYHGSLALRSQRSRDTLMSLRKRESVTVFFDVNLRDPWWDIDSVLATLSGVHWLKVNADEFEMLAPAGQTPAVRAGRMIERHGLMRLLVTHGSEGASLFTAEGAELVTRPTVVVDVVDTVGAGDAFSAVMIVGILRGWQLQESLDRAQAFASALIGRQGATVHDPAFYKSFSESWN